MMCLNPENRLTIADVLEHPWLADDRENTTRVEKIMYPSGIIPTPPATKNGKRSAGDDDSSTTESSSKVIDEKPSESKYSSGRPKRVKH
jgi:serine/threonine protein kinase